MNYEIEISNHKNSKFKNQKLKNYNPNCPNLSEFANNTNTNSKLKSSPPKEDPPLEEKLKTVT